MTILCVGIDSTVLSVALPTLAKSLDASEPDLQCFLGILLVFAGAKLSAGLLGDGYAKRLFLKFAGFVRRWFG